MKITPDQAIARVKASMQKQEPSGKRMVKAQASVMEYIGDINFKIDGDTTMYLLKEGDTYTIAPNDDSDNIVPILGQWEGDVNIEGPLPPNMASWLEGYEKEIEAYNSNISESQDLSAEENNGPLNVASANSRTTIAPLLNDLSGGRGKNRWNQYAPFNDRLGGIDPKNPNTKMLVGCGALALSQIIYYWGCLAPKKYDRGGYPTKIYTTETNHYKISELPPLRVFDYSHMAGTLSDNMEERALQVKAISTLCEYVGKGIKSDYSSNLTLSYDTSLLSYLKKIGFYLGAQQTGWSFQAKHPEDWEQWVYDQLAIGRPVILRGRNSNNTGGHFFVCDGYKSSSNLFHINWGFPQSELNGYFALSSLIKKGTTLNYNYNRSALIGIQPTFIRGDVNGDGVIDVSDIMSIVQDILDRKYRPEADINNDGQVDTEDWKPLLDYVLHKRKDF